MPGERKNTLHGACSLLRAALPAGAHGDKPYLVAWLDAADRLPAETWMELAEIIIESLVQDRHAIKASRIEVSEQRREMEAMRVESVLLRLEAVLARAAGRAAQHDARFNRKAARLLRDEAVRGRAVAAA